MQIILSGINPVTLGFLLRMEEIGASNRNIKLLFWDTDKNWNETNISSGDYCADIYNLLKTYYPSLQITEKRGYCESNVRWKNVWMKVMERLPIFQIRNEVIGLNVLDKTLAVHNNKDLDREIHYDIMISSTSHPKVNPPLGKKYKIFKAFINDVTTDTKYGNINGIEYYIGNPLDGFREVYFVVDADNLNWKKDVSFVLESVKEIRQFQSTLPKDCPDLRIFHRPWNGFDDMMGCREGVRLANKLLLGVEEVVHPVIPFRFRSEYEFVIAHYNEDITWTMPFADKTTLYHKGDRIPDPSFNRWIRLPNVGRESHTYLYHIINNYDNLADVTVFLQGKIEDHKTYVYAHVFDYILEAKKRQLGVKRVTTHNTWGRLEHVGKWLEELNTGKMRKSKYNFEQFWNYLFDAEHPDFIRSFHFACFSVTKERIWKRPKKFYKKMIQLVNDHVNPEDGHYIERIWYVVFSEFFGKENL